MDSMRARNGVRQTALMGHIVVLMGRFMMSIAEDGKGALRLGGGQGRFFGRFSQDRRLRRKASFRNGI